jgi:hypothetical protein
MPKRTGTLLMKYGEDLHHVVLVNEIDGERETPRKNAPSL